MRNVMFVGLFLLTACHSDSRTRFSASYHADKSRLDALVKSATTCMVRAGGCETGVGTRGSARIIFCPSANQPGRSFRLAAVIISDTEVQLSSDVKTVNWTYSNAAPLEVFLSANGFTELDGVEIQRLNHALFNALSGPKGYVLKGQGRAIEVTSATIEYNTSIAVEQPPNNWMEPTELPLCSLS